MTARRILPLALGVLAAALATGAGLAPARAETPAATNGHRGLAVSVVKAREAELVERAGVTGSLVPREEVLVSPELEGLRIVEVLAEEGDRVAKGQVLVRLSREALDAQAAQSDAALARLDALVAQARSQIAEAEAARVEAVSALDRARTLNRSGNTSDAVLETRTAAARSSEARLAAAREGLRVAEAQTAETRALRRELEVRLARTEVRAPTAGVVSRRAARLGASATAASDPLFRLIADGDVELEADVPEVVLGKLAVGQPARVELIGRDEPATGRVRLISPEINRQSRLGRVRIAIERTGDGRPPTLGTFARASVETARRRGVAVPVAAVQFGVDGAVVQVVTRPADAAEGTGVVETRAVEVGLRAGGEVEIRSGVREGESVVAVAGTFLRQGDRVRPVEPGPAPAPAATSSTAPAGAATAAAASAN